MVSCYYKGGAQENDRAVRQKKTPKTPQTFVNLATAAYYEEDITRNYPARCQSANLAWFITLIVVQSLTKFVFFKYLFSHDSFAKLTLTLTLIDTIKAPKTSSCFCIHSAQSDILTCPRLHPRTLLFIPQNKSSSCVCKFSRPSRISQFMLFCPQLRPLSVSFLHRTPGKEYHSQAGSTTPAPSKPQLVASQSSRVTNIFLTQVAAPPACITQQVPSKSQVKISTPARIFPPQAPISHFSLLSPQLVPSQRDDTAPAGCGF